MATNVSNLAQAMDAAGYRTNKALAEAAGISPASIGLILKRGTCNPSTAEKLQAACGEHRIGPYVETAGPSQAEEVAAALPEYVAFEGKPFFRDEVNGHLVITGTRKSREGIIRWGAAVYDPDGMLVAETDFNYGSFIPPRDDGAALAKEVGS